MNIKNIILLIGLLLVWTACKKKKTEEAAPKQYSTWIVNNHDTFRTNNVDSSIDCNPDHSYCVAQLSSHDLPNRFALGFYLSFLPISGNWPIANDTSIGESSNYVFLTFYYNSQFYIASFNQGSNYITINIVN